MDDQANDEHNTIAPRAQTILPPSLPSTAQDFVATARSVEAVCWDLGSVLETENIGATFHAGTPASSDSTSHVRMRKRPTRQAAVRVDESGPQSRRRED